MTQNDGSIEYADIFSALNWRECPVAKPSASSEQEESDFGSNRHTDDPRMLDQTTHERKKFNVDYSALLKDVGINLSYPGST